MQPYSSGGGFGRSGKRKESSSGCWPKRREWPPVHLSQLETGKAQPSFDAIVTFARILGVPMYSFFLFDRDMDDPRLLRKRIEAMVKTSDASRLKQVHRLMMDILEPIISNSLFRSALPESQNNLHDAPELIRRFPACRPAKVQS